MGFFAFLLPILTWRQAALCAFIALLFNIFIMPRLGGKKLLRPGQEGKWLLSGIVGYPAVVLLLILMFRNHPEVVMMAWGIMAFGDGFAGIFGRLIGGPRLPWNVDKTWAGFFTMFMVSEASCVAMHYYYSLYNDSFLNNKITEIISILLIPSLISAIIESLPSRLDDNWYLPLFISPLIFFSEFDAFYGEVTSPIVNPIIGILMGSFALFDSYLYLKIIWSAYLSILNLILALLVWRLRVMSGRGAIIGFFLANGLLAWTGIFGFGLLFVFFVLSTISGIIKKYKTGGNIEKRDESSVFSKGMVGLVLAYFLPISHIAPMLITQSDEFYFLVSIPIIAAWASAAFDTVSSDIGSAYGKRAFHVWGFKKVASGTEGAVSMVGTFAGIIASIIVAISAIVFYSILFGYKATISMSTFILPKFISVLITASFLSNMTESLLGQLLEEKGYITKTISNLFVTGFAAYLAFILWDLLFFGMYK